MPVPAWQWQQDDLTLLVRVQPRASRDEWLGQHGDVFRVRITASPVDGRANAHLLAFLARTFGVAKSRVELLSGATARQKRIKIQCPQRFPDNFPDPA